MLVQAIVFLGQFGGNSAYLQKRMASNPISRKVHLRHSQSGKMDVVKGAMSERLTLEETFVRRFRTLKSYGTLITLLYDDEVARLFPHPQRQGAVPFERASDGPRLKVIEWAIPKVSVSQKARMRIDTDLSGILGDSCTRRSNSRHWQRRSSTSHMAISRE
jgi:hypothetical protein